MQHKKVEEVDWNFLLVFWPLNFPLYILRSLRLTKISFFLRWLFSPSPSFGSIDCVSVSKKSAWKTVMKNSIKTDEMTPCYGDTKMKPLAEINDVEAVTLHIDCCVGSERTSHIQIFRSHSFIFSYFSLLSSSWVMSCIRYKFSIERFCEFPFCLRALENGKVPSFNATGRIDLFWVISCIEFNVQKCFQYSAMVK